MLQTAAELIDRRTAGTAQELTLRAPELRTPWRRARRCW